MKRWLCLLFAVLLLAFNAGAALASRPDWFGLQDGKIFASKHVRAELVAYAPQGIVAGADAWFGLKIKHEPDWHTYWKNPGDVGVPTQLEWVLPEGISVSEILWPTPEVLYIGSDIVDYGYEGEVLLPVKVHVSDEFKGAEVDVKVHASWLVCRLECIPEQANFSLKVPTQQSMTSEVKLFERFLQRHPFALEGVQSTVRIEPIENNQDNEYVLSWEVAGLPERWQGEELLLMPEQREVMVNSGAKESGWIGNVWYGRFQLSNSRSTEPRSIEAILLPANQLTTQGEPIDDVGVRVTAQVEGSWPEAVVYEIPPSLWQENSSDVATDSSTELPHSELFASSNTSLWLIIGFAIVGGLLLNLMPCVFPVLSLTVLSLASSGQHSQREQKLGGLAHGAGIIITMLLLASVLLILRAGGAALGWGFQLQSPLFVAGLAALFVLIALNLFGVYEVKVFLPQRVSGLKSTNLVLDAFFSGVVSVLVATPCTAPFMGAALGAALTMPAWQTLLVFLVLGVGLALPVVVLTFVPQLMRLMPAPGAWMGTFRQLMAFPMLLAVLWLVWVVSMQAGASGAVGLMLILLSLSFLMWVVGWMQHTLTLSYIWKCIVLIFALLCIIGSIFWFTSELSLYRDSREAVTTNFTGNEDAPLTAWGEWSAQKVDAYLEQKQVVFVDFTAAWCVTCQLNKKATLSHSDVLKAFSDNNVVLLRADWTNNDPLITEELARLGRSGVPVYVLYQAGQKPQILPEVLTHQIVYDALDALKL